MTEPAEQAQAARAGLGRTQSGQTGPGQPQAGQSQAGRTQAGRTETGQTETGRSQTGQTETGRTETGQAETGQAETGQAETGQTGAGGGNRRPYLLALLACLAGAGIAAYGATRTWSVEITPRPEMSNLRTVRTGVDIAPWVIGLALVGLAGTGALLATHGRLRRALGGLLMLVGAGVAISAVAGRAGLDTGEAGPGGTIWPLACVLGGVIVALGGLTAARLGHLWPRMSARYERKPAATENREVTTGPVDSRAAWDSLDRGDDPTV
ncbi:hypothetical protein Aab01nite_41180 [Paractinoplanes abujensis]|uniref:Putative membrane protein (TIGR02234 family) n=1 Tax=Paractinoplanes abujensis TaxID=882441 RepID=A0A7W7CT94_9ACTN|nr:Trp biosynthesis-associated membrane protein [Actinoplanes abujensis]MBB4694259.1 putative membrane protein (TIGR02234 family) [Actinoplanes abujensis]GID20528.1 hypothetical protein Aab01nite_41180 [Actinoplanes abujensis]